MENRKLLAIGKAVAIWVPSLLLAALFIMQGVMKLTGLPLFIPIFAFFIDSAWEYAFGIIPTYWPMKTYWLLQAGEPG